MLPRKWQELSYLENSGFQMRGRNGSVFFFARNGYPQFGSKKIKIKKNKTKEIYSQQISYYFDQLGLIEMGFLLELGMINMDTQPLVPYWDLFNQALPLNQEPKYSLFLISVPSPHAPILFHSFFIIPLKKIFASAVIPFRIALSEFSSKPTHRLQIYF